ncbi:metallophosphoesterase family protein [Paenibacillus sp. MABNR03]|uniref:metallophosphoesterase family protein n=1 Tax=Paenibacillus sp. MABNR03 TaxID=3142626 RepID=UPI003D2DE2BF
MKIALIGDIHSRFAQAEQVVTKIRTDQTEAEIICMGDVFEVEKKPVYSADETAIEPMPLSDYVMNSTHSFIHTLNTFSGVIGNQEEKLMKLMPSTQIPENIAIFLGYPREITKGDLLFIHGHQLSWVERDPDVFHPLIENAMLTYRLFFYGHNHDQRLFGVNQVDGEMLYEEIPIQLGSPIPLDKYEKYLINVGDIKSTPSKWAIYCSDADTITFYELSPAKV